MDWQDYIHLTYQYLDDMRIETYIRGETDIEKLKFELNNYMRELHGLPDEFDDNLFNFITDVEFIEYLQKRYSDRGFCSYEYTTYSVKLTK